MKASDYIVSKLVEYGATDAFGVPGGVILKLLYAMEESKGLSPHLMLHEQSAGFAACGYAQASGRLGVAYATRGPGITNMITCIAEAYQESIPVFFITAHGNHKKTERRFEDNQELEITGLVSSITKYAITIERIESVSSELKKACEIALSGRKGPVLVDILASLYDKEIYEISVPTEKQCGSNTNCVEAVDKIKSAMKKAKRPVMLIGDGMRNLVSEKTMDRFSEQIKIPIISSRGAQDILMRYPYYYGYIGSHGIRYSNFILSKADLVIVIGNRLAFPPESESYAPVIKRIKIIRLDVDEKELLRDIENAENFLTDARDLILYMARQNITLSADMGWIKVCDRLKQELQEYDQPLPVKQLIKYMNNQKEKTIYVSDVGNNEFFVSRAVEAVHPDGMLLCSKSYGTLGVALGRAIGAYYATGQNVVCIIGDQGFQYNTQDLYYIARHELPITVIVLNNNSSGMISDHEHKLFGDKQVHVNEKCDYYVPDLAAISKAYGFEYTNNYDKREKSDFINVLYEIRFDEDITLTPNLPKGNPCQNMEPAIGEDQYKVLDQL